jgi:hypothetical protein
MAKLYAYIDESGQETLGILFLASALTFERADLESISVLLARIEKQSGKGIAKWSDANKHRRRAYIRTLLTADHLAGKLYYGEYRNTLKYREAIANIAAQSITQNAQIRVLLSGQGIPIRKVTSATDQASVFIRAADAVCGFIRDALEGEPEYRRLLDKALREGFIVQVNK